MSRNGNIPGMETAEKCISLTGIIVVLGLFGILGTGLCNTSPNCGVYLVSYYFMFPTVLGLAYYTLKLCSNRTRTHVIALRVVNGGRQDRARFKRTEPRINSAATSKSTSADGGQPSKLVPNAQSRTMDSASLAEERPISISTISSASTFNDYSEISRAHPHPAAFDSGKTDFPIATAQPLRKGSWFSV